MKRSSHQSSRTTPRGAHQLNRLLLVVACWVAVGCKAPQACTKPHLHAIAQIGGGNEKGDVYYLVLMLDSYAERCFSDYDFVAMGDHYLATTKSERPVAGITFVEPFDFHPHYDSRDSEPIGEHALASLSYSTKIDTLENDSTDNDSTEGATRVPTITGASILGKDLGTFVESTRRRGVEVARESAEHSPTDARP